ncbi:MAG: NACHT domain-containing protein [Elainellaceae cyanobacterium]
MSTPLLVLKVIGPPLAQGLLTAFDVKSKLANAIRPKTIQTAVSSLLKPGANDVDPSRKVAEISNQMADDIRPLFEGHDRQVEASSRDAIVWGLAETLIKAGLTQAGLAEINFDAEALERHLLKANPGAERDFSAAERSVYRQAVRRVSQRLIDVAPSVEGYEQAKTAEVLQRLEAIARELGVERDLALQAADEFVGRYRGVVEDELDRLEVFGLRRMDQLTSKQSLSMAYITLSASGVANEAQGNRFAAPGIAHDIDGERSGKGPRRILGQVDEVICDCRRVVIRGGAGAGKSTLMQWLAVRAGTQSFEEKLIAWNAKIPFFIRLRDLVGKEFPSPEAFPALIAKNIAAWMPDGWVHKYLDRGQALVLIDGVDELPKKDRESFFDALQDLVRDFPQATYIVTSRPSGLKSVEGGAWEDWEDWVSAQEFQTLMLEPMTPLKVKAFVAQWHRALPAPEPGDPCPEPEQAAQKLIRQLQQRPELQRLASTPLLCAMICALHRERLETLPNARLQLYYECIDMLLNRRDKNRKIDLDDSYPIGLDESQKIELLQSLALKLMRANLSSLEAERVDRHFGQELKQTSLPSTVTGRQIRALFVDRAALLREPVVGQIDFAHRTFQEYLAAKAILDDDSLEELMEKAVDQQWREAVIAAAGLTRKGERSKLLRHLVNWGNSGAANNAPDEAVPWVEDDEAVKTEKYMCLLAVACLETATTVDPEVRSHVLTCAKAQMPPQDDDEVAMVVRAGNEVVPLLKYEEVYSGEEASRCIQALVGVGTDVAMATIEDYAKARFELDQDEVGQALGRGWDVFDRGAYLAQVLSHTDVLDLSQAQVSDASP